jgi:parvulin-like peptidyl-prolyl isomerase
MTWSDGRKYVGEWKQDKRNGKGTLSIPNGDMYEGEFKDDKFDGKGTYTYADGRSYTGDFKDDKFVAGETTEPKASENLIDKVAAVVNNDVITLSEVKQAASFSNQNPDDTKVQKELLEMMIEERLLQQEATKLGIKVTDKEIDAAIEDIKKKFNLSEEQMEEVLKKQNYTQESFREQWRRQILSNKLMGSRVQGQIAVTDDEVKQYYEANKGDLKLAQETRIAQILIPVESPENEKQAETQALEVAKLAKAGGDFSALAKQYSKDPSSAERGGDLGYFKKGDMAPQLEIALEETPVGEVLGPVRAPTGYMIIKVLDKRSADTSSLDPDKVKEEVRQKLYQKKVEDSIKAWLQEVKKTAYIEKKI